MNLLEKILALAPATGTNALDNEAVTGPIINTSDQWTIGTLVGAAITWVSLAAGVIAFFYLVYSGFMYLTAGGNADSAKKGQQGILNAIIGLVIIALSYAIFRAVVSAL